MKKTFIVFALLSLLLIGSTKRPNRLVQLTIINKSGLAIEVSLTGNTEDEELFYYFRIPEGNRALPSEKTFEVLPETYQMNAYFDELWDPVYGASCEDRQGSVDITRNTRVVVMECDYTPPNGGEPSQIKLGGRNQRLGGR